MTSPSASDAGSDAGLDAATRALADRGGAPSLRPGVHWEYRTLTMPRGTTRTDARQLLTEHAEYGRWELARVRLYVGGLREIQLRRKVMRVERSF